MTSVTITIPLPPSVNKAWSNVPGKGRVKTNDYKRWETEAGWLARSQYVGKPPITGAVHVAIWLHRPRGRCDIDNRIKPILDLLVKAGVLADDSQVVKICAEWSIVDGAIVEIKEVEK
jgi:Holliday junction resolvase RusA-like endonuclease